MPTAWSWYAIHLSFPSRGPTERTIAAFRAMRGERDRWVAVGAMELQQVVEVVRAFEDRQAVTIDTIARALGADVDTTQRAVDQLVTAHELECSVLRTRPSLGEQLAVRALWYHTPAREARARLGHDVGRDGQNDGAPDAEAVDLREAALIDDEGTQPELFSSPSAHGSQPAVPDARAT